MEWAAPDGSIHSATFDDRLNAERASQRLRTALSLDGEWLPSVLRAAHGRLTEVRREQPNAGGLVIATDQEHARGIAELLRTRFGTTARVVTSDDPTASAGIAAFAAGSDPWLVAVRMVSEGVDIPRLRVGVFATTTTTELFFRQAVGRLVRWTRGVRRQRAWLFIPDDPRLRLHAARRRRAAAALAAPRRDGDARERDEHEAIDGDDEQMSLFAVISAVATDASEPFGDFGEDDDELDDGGGGRVRADARAAAAARRRDRRRSRRGDAHAQGGEASAARVERDGRARARAPHAHDARPGERRAEPALEGAQGVGGDGRASSSGGSPQPIAGWRRPELSRGAA